MPLALKIIFEDKTQKKILWKDSYRSITELKKICTLNLNIENNFVGIFAQTPQGLEMLISDDDVSEFIAKFSESQSLVVQIALTPISRDETFISKDYSSIYRTRTPGIPKDCIRPEYSLKSSNAELYKNLKTSDYLSFSDKNYSPYHVIRKIEGNLLAEGFSRLLESEKWVLIPGKKYYVKRGYFSGVIAFTIPAKMDTDNLFFKIAGTHCDSPCLRLCPQSKIINGEYLQLDVMTYGGGLWKTWFDRELSIGGRVTIKNKSDPNKLEVKVYTSTNAFAYIPSLCPHLQNTIDETALNPEIHLRPIIGLNGKTKEINVEGDNYDFLLQDISDSLEIPKDLIVDFELCLADATKAKLFGPKQEFLAASKMDNTVSAWAALDGIINCSQKPELLPSNGVPILAVFDHEEIGSISTTGANSEFLPDILKRIVFSISTEKFAVFENYKRSISKSILVSADMGHVTHPNYTEYFKTNYKPTLNKGILLKTNDNLKYTSTSISRTIIKKIAEEKQIPLQNYVGRNDKHSGSTIGPFLSSLLGIESVDIGGGLLAMHSIRELMGVEDLMNYAELFGLIFKASLPTISDNFK